jgi:hypothetical protein
LLEVVNTPRPANLLITPEKNTLSESLQGLQRNVNNSEKKTTLLIAKSNYMTGVFFVIQTLNQVIVKKNLL